MKKILLISSLAFIFLCSCKGEKKTCVRECSKTAIDANKKCLKKKEETEKKFCVEQVLKEGKACLAECPQ